MLIQGNNLFLILSDAAYTDALKSYHGWVVRGIFAVSTHAPGRVLCFVPVVNVR